MSTCPWLKFKYKINSIKSPHKAIYNKKTDHRDQIDKKFHEMKQDAGSSRNICALWIQLANISRTSRETIKV